METVNIKQIGADVVSAYENKIAEAIERYKDKMVERYGKDSGYVKLLKDMIADAREKSSMTDDEKNFVIALPSFFDAARILRLKGIYIDITTRVVDNADKDVFFSYRIQQRRDGKIYWDTSDGEFGSWDEAMESALQFATNKMLTTM